MVKSGWTDLASVNKGEVRTQWDVFDEGCDGLGGRLTLLWPIFVWGLRGPSHLKSVEREQSSSTLGTEEAAEALLDARDTL
jgi:hypothetical protein